MRALIFAILFVVQALPVCAAQNGAALGKLGASVLGYASDPAAGLRPLCGIPGAAMLGEAVDFEAALLAPVAAPDRDYFLALTSADAVPVVMLAGADGALTETRIPDAAPGADGIRLSPGGSAALLVHSAEAWAEVVSGLPDAPVVARRIDFSATGFTPRLLVVSDDGRLALAAPAAADGVPPLWFGEDGRPHTIPVPAASAFAFSAGSHTALIVNSGDDRIWVVSDIGGEPAYQAVAGHGLVANAVDAGFSNDGRRFFVANADGTVARFDLEDGAPQTTACPCTIDGLRRLRGNSVFLLDGSAVNPRYVLDGGLDQPRIFFVPLEGGN